MDAQKLEKIFTPLRVGDVEIKNRFIMAPLTRIRETEEHVPTQMMVKHYADRASAGLIIAAARSPTRASRAQWALFYLMKLCLA